MLEEAELINIARLIGRRKATPQLPTAAQAACFLPRRLHHLTTQHLDNIYVIIFPLVENNELNKDYKTTGVHWNIGILELRL